MTTMDDVAGSATARRLAELEARVLELTARLEAAGVAPLSEDVSVGADRPATTDEAADTGPSTSRRHALRWAGAAVVGALGAAAGASGQAAADVNDPILLGQTPDDTNISSVPTRVTYTGQGATTSGFLFASAQASGSNAATTNQGNFGAALSGWALPGRNIPNGVYGLSSNGAGYGVVGQNLSINGGAGVLGTSATGTGVTGQTTNGTSGVSGTTNLREGSGVLGIGGFAGVLGFSGDYSLASQLSNKANLFLQPNNDLGETKVPKTRPSTRTDVHRQGEIENVDGDLWYCVSGGTPGQWRKLSGPSAAGAFHAIAPARAYDSRSPEPAPGLLTLGVPRTVSLAAARDLDTGATVNPNLVPAGATAVLANVTVANTAGAGFLTINPGTAANISSSTINWSSSGQILNNGVSLTLGGDRQVTIVPGGSVGSATDVIIDITGYFL